MNNIPMMPLEYRGKEKTGCGFTFTAPREWNSQEIEWLKKMQMGGAFNQGDCQEHGQN